MKTIAVSIGDLNGIGLQVALEAHAHISTLCRPVYCVNETMATWGAAMLGYDLPADMVLHPVEGIFEIRPGMIDPESGLASFRSFQEAVDLTRAGKADALVTLPIHKKGWELAGIPYKGHTDALRDFFDRDAIMMLGCDELFVALFTEHIPLREVAESIKSKKLTRFLLAFHGAVRTAPIGVLGLNPHAGDRGVLGNEEEKIARAIRAANAALGATVFEGPLVPDTAFTPASRRRYSHLAAMYHDQGLAPLKALYFDESVNVSLGLPVIRTSVDHGTAFDIAYKGLPVSTVSYINAVKTAIRFTA